MAKAQYIMDGATLDKQIYHEPGFFAGWNGSATAGATVVSASSNQYTFTGAVNLVRAFLGGVARRAEQDDFRVQRIVRQDHAAGLFVSGNAPSHRDHVPVPAVVTKSSISHLGAERDEYFSPRVYVLAQMAFDHNYAQDLQLQQIYGGGFGWTATKSPKHEVDLKGTRSMRSSSLFPERRL